MRLWLCVNDIDWDPRSPLLLFPPACVCVLCWVRGVQVTKPEARADLFLLLRATIMNHRRSTRMRVHLQQQERHNGCSLSSGSIRESKENGDSCSSSEKQNKEKISFISCARGFPVDAATADFPFSPPDLAPTFRPTEQEFAAGPLKYIASIRHLAEPYGICKIIPPAVSSEAAFYPLTSCMKVVAESESHVRTAAPPDLPDCLSHFHCCCILITFMSVCFGTEFQAQVFGGHGRLYVHSSCPTAE